MSSRLLKPVLLALFWLAVNPAYARPGGDAGGNGDKATENFNYAALTAIDNVKLFAQFSKYSEQLEDYVSNPPKIDVVKSLLNCDGQPLKNSDTNKVYAHFCKGRLQLLNTYWNGWLETKYSALAVREKILHEVFRATKNGNDRYSDDEGFVVTHRILKTTDLLTIPKCQKKSELDIEQNRDGSFDISPYQSDKQKVVSQCFLGIVGLDQDLVNEMVELRTSCIELAAKYEFTTQHKGSEIFMKNGKPFARFALTRSCLSDEVESQEKPTALVQKFNLEESEAVETEDISIGSLSGRVNFSTSKRVWGYFKKGDKTAGFGFRGDTMIAYFPKSRSDQQVRFDASRLFSENGGPFADINSLELFMIGASPQCPIVVSVDINNKIVTGISSCN